VLSTIGGILEVFQRWIRKMDVTMILAMHLPIIGFILLSHFHPGSVFYIYATVIAEQFGYGFGLLLS
jgi:PAT family beta-lactamase induction signal transducer AmpG